MAFSLFKKTDPVCGMKQEKGKGIEKYGKWFCNNSCLEVYEKKIKKSNRKDCCY